MSTVKIHPFEEAGFGYAPFRYVGYRRSVFQAAPGAPIQPGTTCDFCGQSIMDVFAVRSSDGREFKVGCDCIRRVYAEFDGDVPPDARKAIADMQREKREAKRARDMERARARAQAASELLAEHPDWFADRPHPYASAGGRFEGLKLRDYFDFCLNHGGTGGMNATARTVEAKAAAQEENP